MSSTNFDSFKISLDDREIEKRFREVYGSVIWDFFVFNSSYRHIHIQDLISNVILNYNKERKILKADLPSYQFLFLLSFGIQDSCVSARTFLESLVNQTKVVKKLSDSNPIELFCFESESLPAVIGVCQVINEVAKKFKSSSKTDLTRIGISVIDTRENWRRLCECIVITANSYLENVELKLDFVDNSENWSPERLVERIRKIDLVIVARIFAEDLVFTQNYCFMHIILKEMKKDAILFYFDSCNKEYYDNLKNLISKTDVFSEVNSCEMLNASFEDLGSEQNDLDPPLSWDTNFEPVMFTTWIKNRDRKNSIISTAENVAKCSSESSPTNVVNKKSKVKCPTSQSDSTSGQRNVINAKKKVKSSKKRGNLPDSPSAHPNAVNKEKKAESATKYSNPNVSAVLTAQTTTSKSKNKSCIPNNYNKISTLITFLDKQTNNFEAEKSDCVKISSNTTISQKALPKEKGQLSSTKEIVSENSISPGKKNIIKPNKKNETNSSKISISDAGKMVTLKQENKTLLSKQSESASVSTSVVKSGLPQEKSKGKPVEKCSKNNIDSASNTSKGKCEPKTNNKKTSISTDPEVKSQISFPVKSKLVKNNAAKTKKSIKGNATEKVKLTGKFACMDLEKKNKDERHKIRAKKASFDKYANFDYDD